MDVRHLFLKIIPKAEQHASNISLSPTNDKLWNNVYLPNVMPLLTWYFCTHLLTIISRNDHGVAKVEIHDNGGFCAPRVLSRHGESLISIAVQLKPMDAESPQHLPTATVILTLDRGM